MKIYWAVFVSHLQSSDFGFERCGVALHDDF
jgi:hypothetical protein